jgi:hypothetical protein
VLQAYAESQGGQTLANGYLPPSSTALSLVPFRGSSNSNNFTGVSTGSKLLVLPPSYEEMSSGGENSEGEGDERPLTRIELEKVTFRDFLRKK